MIRLLVLTLFLTGFSTQAFAYGYCEWEAQSLMQKMGGEQLTQTYSRVSGWTVNDSGSESYRFVRGNEVCGISYHVFGTYFGVKCSDEWGGVYCSVPGKRSKRR